MTRRMRWAAAAGLLVVSGWPGAAAAAGGPVATGDGFSCSSGFYRIRCWGDGDSGRLGTGDTAGSLEPVPSGRGRSSQMSAGRAHACAVLSGPSLRCWGRNDDGQVGDGTTVTRTEPVELSRDVRQVAAGDHHTCAVTTAGGVECWGRNDRGQLGLGAAGASVPVPQPVPGLAGVTDLTAGGDTTCAIVEDGGAWCWGSDEWGQAGDGGGAAPGPVPAPVRVASSGQGRLLRIAAGRRHTCAFSLRAVVWCWGDDSSGQLGDGPSGPGSSVPVAADWVPDVAADVPLRQHITSISAGAGSTCAVAYSSRVFCWGANDHGQLGTGDRVDRDVPVPVDQSPVAPTSVGGPDAGRGSLSAVSVGDGHACALDSSDTPYCWGDNRTGQIGDGTTRDALVPAATTLRPGPATGVTVIPRDRAVEVSWTAPVHRGPAGPVEYVVFATRFPGQPTRSAGTCTVTVLHCVIGPLVNGIRYRVYVITWTDGGKSLSAQIPAVPVAAGSPSPSPSRPGGPGGSGGGGLPVTGGAPGPAAVLGVLLVGLGLAGRRLASGRRRFASGRRRFVSGRR